MTVMDAAKLKTFSRVRTFSSTVVAAAIALSLIFSSWLGADSLSWQVAMAVVALAIGIPHGALDHLVTLPKAQPIKMALFIAIYVAIALAAIWAILQWNVWGFIAVVIISAIQISEMFFYPIRERKTSATSRFNSGAPGIA